jgi:SAM-dependent methyltransferase
MNERINVQYHYYDDRILGKTIHNTQKIYQSVFRSLENRTFKYYKDEIKEFYDALDDYPIKDKQVLVWGLSGCNCDAIALWKKAAEVYVVDYNLPICDHESVHPLTHNELQNLNIKFDYAISFSSFEHDGLGRYGDPINPDGDLRAMREASNYLKDEGIMLLGVPLGPDCLCWNAHRIYGPVRLPLLLHGWFPLDVYSIYPGVFDEPSGVVRQPLLVLKKCVSKRGYAEKILHLFRSTLSSAHTGKITGTKNYDLLSKILEFILLDRLDGICNNDNCTTKR